MPHSTYAQKHKYTIKVVSVEYLFGMYAKSFQAYCGTPYELYVVGAKCVSKSLAASRRPMHDGCVLLCDITWQFYETAECPYILCIYRVCMYGKCLYISVYTIICKCV